MIELELNSTYPRQIIACDEVGRGPLCGPVVAGAMSVVVHSKKDLNKLLKALSDLGIDDSKKLSDKKRLIILQHLSLTTLGLRKVAVINISGFEIKLVCWDLSHEVVDEMNILAASLEAMKVSSLEISDMSFGRPLVLIDGNKTFRWGSEVSPFEEVSIVKGDSRSKLIGLASVLAKFIRDEHMKLMHSLYPHYGMDKHAGYPTATHRKAIENHGPSPIHRKTFKGVKEFVR